MSKKRKRVDDGDDNDNNDNSDLFIQSKKPKKSKDNPVIDYFVTKNKCTNVTGNNKLSYRDDSAAGINYNIIDEDNLPPSMKNDKKYLIPKREYQTSTNLDDTSMRHNIKQPFINNDDDGPNHIITIIPHGFQDILSVKSTLEIAMSSCKKDADTINSNISKNNNIEKKDNNVINKIEIVGKENTSANYIIMRLSKNLITSTIEEFYNKKIELEKEFFKNDDIDANAQINSDLYKSELFKKLRDSYETQYKNRNNFMKITASSEPKKSIPCLTRAYIKSFRYPPIKSSGERECIKRYSCLFYTFQSFQSNKNEKYIGKEFLLPQELDDFTTNNKLPNVIGPCIDCLLYDWSNKIHDNQQFNKFESTAINTFTVRVEENEYSGDVCLPRTFLNGQITGIYGFVPAYASSHRGYVTETRTIKINNNNNNKYKNWGFIPTKKEQSYYEEISVTYLAEINMDFRLPLVK